MYKFNHNGWSISLGRERTFFLLNNSHDRILCSFACVRPYYKWCIYIYAMLRLLGKQPENLMRKLLFLYAFQFSTLNFFSLFHPGSSLPFFLFCFSSINSSLCKSFFPLFLVIYQSSCINSYSFWCNPKSSKPINHFWLFVFFLFLFLFFTTL